MRAVLLSVFVALITGVATPDTASAQWVEDPGTGWIKLQGAHQNTQKKFDHEGNIEPIKLDEAARSITSSVRLTGALGLWRGVDVWSDVPYRQLQFNDSARDRQSTGISDPRFFLRFGPSLFGLDNLPFAVALRNGVKLPLGEFAVDAQIIPLSEGQRDWEMLLELGKSLHPWPMYVMGWVGYRWRESNTEIQRKPGDEKLLYVAAGGSVDRFQWKLAIDGLFGEPPVRTAFDLSLENERRQLVQIIPTAGWEVGPGAIGVGARLPVYGRNFPAGPIFTLGYFVTWSKPLW